MKKEDKLNLAFGKCFNSSPLTSEECSLISSITLQELMNKHWFNENQSRKILLWCQAEMQRSSNNYSLETREESLSSNSIYYRT